MAMTCVIDQQVSHHGGGDGKEMAAILPGRLLPGEQLDEGFLDE
jgi:hypothetical protein